VCEPRKPETPVNSTFFIAVYFVSKLSMPVHHGTYQMVKTNDTANCSAIPT
jgi:hypothetical protein